MIPGRNDTSSNGSGLYGRPAANPPRRPAARHDTAETVVMPAAKLEPGQPGYIPPEPWAQPQYAQPAPLKPSADINWVKTEAQEKEAEVQTVEPRYGKGTQVFGYSVGAVAGTFFVATFALVLLKLFLVIKHILGL